MQLCKTRNLEIRSRPSKDGLSGVALDCHGRGDGSLARVFNNSNPKAVQCSSGRAPGLCSRRAFMTQKASRNRSKSTRLSHARALGSDCLGTL
jgi:hypothetical protein